MQAQATLKYARIAPRKVRIILDVIREAPDAEIALSQLKLMNKKGARLVHKLLASAVANAGIKFGVTDPSRLEVAAAFANEGPTLRRFRPRAMGRATRINKRTSHVTVVVAELEDY